MFQPAPPPAPPSDFLSLPTITLMIAVTFIMHASAVMFNSRMVREYKGIHTAVWAAGSLALSFVTLLVLPRNFVSGLISNMLNMTGHVLIYVAICQFTGRSLYRPLVYGLVPFGYAALVALVFLPPGGLPLITITQFVGFPLDIASALALYRADTKRYKLGSYLTALPLLVYGLITIVRFITGFVARQQVLPGATASNIFDVLSFYILSYLWVAGFILMISQRLQSDLNDLAMNDALTRVRNRRAMQNMLDFEMRRVQTEVKDFSVILLDVDHFKRVNDAHGHDVGDLVLQWMAQTMQAALRVQDIVSRWGGEEFLILLPDTSLEEAMETADRLRTLVEQTPVANSPIPLKITFSAGVANSKTHRDVNVLCKVADQALYIAKQTRNQIVSEHAIKE